MLFQKLVDDIVVEFRKSIYTKQMVSSTLPTELRGPNPEASLEPVPFFIELAQCKKVGFVDVMD